MPHLSIIIVSWNVHQYLKRCLTSIADHIHTYPELSIETIVVDSASTDDTSTMLSTDYADATWLTVLPQSENIGFTRGNNVGFEAASGTYILMLNPDTEIIGDALITMTRYLDSHPEVGIIGPHTLNTDRTHQSTRRRFPTLWTATFESTIFQRIAPRSVLERFYVHDQPDTGTYRVDWVQGSALMTRRTILNQISNLDEGYTMYSEELDWCKRAAQAGWIAVYMGNAYILHHGGKSAEQVSFNKHLYFQTSKLRYFGKFHTKFTSRALRFLLLTSYILQYVEEWVKLQLRHKPQLRRERTQLYRRVIRHLW